MSELQRLHPRGEWFVDEQGRVVILRGVNLGGDCKVPYTPDESTCNPTDFSSHKDVSFIGRPFPLDEADVHFSRLKSWGFDVLRLLTTWEAVEHAGPGEFDAAYLDYYTNLCKLAGDYGFYVFVDFHQDVWSRMTGGDGAPCWLFEKLGIDYTKLSKADAALVMQHAYNFSDPRPRQEDNYPTMCWSQNYRYPTNGIMWSLFFGGRDFAPGLTIDGENVQDYMQGHYLACQRAIGERVKDLPNVLGFDSLNEPSAGWIGEAMDDRHVKASKGSPALPGLAWSPVDALHVATGHAADLPFLALRLSKLAIVPVKTVRVNPNAVSIFFENVNDPFQAEGAWALRSDGTPEVLRNDFFQVVGNRKINFTRDYMAPFIGRVAETIQNINPDWMIFGEKDAKETVFDTSFPATMPTNFVNASHWYDNALSGTKKVRKITLDVVTMRVVVGRSGIQKMYTSQLGDIKAASLKVNGGSPTLVGEFGLVYDLEGGKAYERWRAGDHSERIWKQHDWTLDMMYNALDANLIGGTQWTYTASSRNDLRIGDGWNQEDCSIYSMDQDIEPGNIYSGGRALHGIVRPFAKFVQGTPTRMAFDQRSGKFVLRFTADPTIPVPTEIFLPVIQYPHGVRIESEGLEVDRDGNEQYARFKAHDAGEKTIIVHRG
jgi:hypothetical protein